MTKKKEVKQESTMVGKYELVNILKVERAIAAVGTDEAAILVEYDKLGGLIRYEGAKVITGAFYDSKTKKAVVDPKPRVIRKQAAVVEEEIVEEAIEEEEIKPKGRKPKVVEEEVIE